MKINFVIQFVVSTLVLEFIRAKAADYELISVKNHTDTENAEKEGRTNNNLIND
jgi:hypothetical protein